MNHLMKPIRSSNLLHGTLFFNTIKPQLKPVTVNSKKKKKKKKVIWSSEKTQDVTQDLGLTPKSKTLSRTLYNLLVNRSFLQRMIKYQDETCTRVWQFNFSKCVFFLSPCRRSPDLHVDGPLLRGRKSWTQAGCSCKLLCVLGLTLKIHT